jgi:tRNA U34 5-methylaminomethyl-2-thiouridine-forming methyltransferase MnmC
MCLLSA